MLRKYRDAGAFTDCLAAEIPMAVSQAEYVEAFYTAWPFKLERLLLAWFVSKPSTDSQAQGLASGALDSFAAWSAEGRTANQLLMCDYLGRTRSWLMSVAGPDHETKTTRLYFGSAFVPLVKARSGRKSMGFAFRALLGFHKIYSRLLLRGAISKLLKQSRRR